MTQDEAVQSAEKRNRHKSPNLGHKEWRPCESDDGTWRVELVDNQFALATMAMNSARDAFRRGDIREFYDLAGEALLARCKAIIGDGK